MAYGSVLQERPKPLHEQTAQAMEDLYRANLDEHYSDLLRITTFVVATPQKQ